MQSDKREIRNKGMLGNKKIRIWFRDIFLSFFKKIKYNKEYILKLLKIINKIKPRL
jgi:hypothetical protein